GAESGWIGQLGDGRLRRGISLSRLRIDGVLNTAMICRPLRASPTFDHYSPWRLQRHPCFEAIRIGKAVGSPPKELAGYRQRLMTLPIGWPVIPSCSACLR